MSEQPTEASELNQVTPQTAPAFATAVSASRALGQGELLLGESSTSPPSPSVEGRRQPRGRPFAPGTSGNPNGRPKGARNRATLIAESLLEGEIAALARKAVERALAGDRVALRLCLGPFLPIRRDRCVAIDKPPVNTVQDVAAASRIIFSACSAAELTLSETDKYLNVLKRHAENLGFKEIEARISELEKVKGEGAS